MPCNERPAGQEETPRGQQHPSQVCQQPDPSAELDPEKCGTACWSLGQSRRPVQEQPKSHMGKEPREKIAGLVAESSAPYVPSPHGECSPGPSSVGLQSGPTVSFPGPASRPRPTAERIRICGDLSSSRAPASTGPPGFACQQHDLG